LTRSSVGVGTHFHANALEDLLDAHVAVPVAHCRQLAAEDFARFIDTIHVDFGDKADLRRFRWILFGAVHAQLVKTIGVVRLSTEKIKNKG